MYSFLLLTTWIATADAPFQMPPGQAPGSHPTNIASDSRR